MSAKERASRVHSFTSLEATQLPKWTWHPTRGPSRVCLFDPPWGQISIFLNIIQNRANFGKSQVSSKSVPLIETVPLLSKKRIMTRAFPPLNLLKKYQSYSPKMALLLVLLLNKTYDASNMPTLFSQTLFANLMLGHM